jgi:aromatic ring-opening dioxygenase catalytic subunit (LigB family)
MFLGEGCGPVEKRKPNAQPEVSETLAEARAERCKFVSSGSRQHLLEIARRNHDDVDVLAVLFVREAASQKNEVAEVAGCAAI